MFSSTESSMIEATVEMKGASILFPQAAANTTFVIAA
ncbi:predicted protein [Botrytis cinerea T4]|uniref:Uncharacterized protein n=1 Tax=Botryotinia fuckeliana (strain T4) TaxID=999810 RepID=G2YNT0_BOTF4|nr:predicted protein [Botrytis cinerea T4]